MTADILDTGAPALSATTDMPAVPEAKPDTALAAVAQPADQQAAVDQGKPEGEQTAEPETPEAEEQADEHAEETPSEGKKPGISERFSKITADRRAAEEARRAADARADKLAENLEKALLTINELSKTKVDPGKTDEDPRPVRTHFDDPNAYDEALIEWSTRVATKTAVANVEAERLKSEEAKKREDANRALTAEQEKIRTQWLEKRDKALEIYTDYEAVAEREDLQISFPMAQAIATSDNGPDIAYHLGKNPKEAERIAAMVMPGQFSADGKPIPDFGRQMFEIGRISAALSNPKKPEISKAPPPIKPTGSRQNVATVDPETETGDEYYARRQAELRASRGR